MARAQFFVRIVSHMQHKLQQGAQLAAELPCFHSLEQREIDLQKAIACDGKHALHMAKPQAKHSVDVDSCKLSARQQASKHALASQRAACRW